MANKRKPGLLAKINKKKKLKSYKFFPQKKKKATKTLFFKEKSTNFRSTFFKNF